MRIIVMLFVVLALNASFVTAEYDKDYLEYDDFGLVEVRCMKCNVPIKKRVIRLHTLEDGRTINVYAVKTLGNFNPVPYELNDGSFTHILMDKDCARKHVDTLAERQGMASQLRKGWVLEAEGAKRSRKEIDAIEDRVKGITVSGKHRFDNTRGRP